MVQRDRQAFLLCTIKRQGVDVHRFPEIRLQDPKAVVRLNSSCAHNFTLSVSGDVAASAPDHAGVQIDLRTDNEHALSNRVPVITRLRLICPEDFVSILNSYVDSRRLFVAAA